MSWRLLYTKQARKDAKKLAAAGLKPKAQVLLDVLAADPFQSPPPYEKLVDDLQGAFSRRITIQHLLVHRVLTDESIIKVLRMWTQYEQGVSGSRIECAEGLTRTPRRPAGLHFWCAPMAPPPCRRLSRASMLATY